MRTRFASNILLGLAAGFVVVASQAFSATVTGWITFGVALGVLGLVGLTQLARGGGVARWVLDAVLAVAGLIAHEVSTERVVHHLEIEHTNRESAPEYARAA
jgi:hypothetical protein